MHYDNPYDGKSIEEIYQGLMSGEFGPQWPNEDLQQGYTGTNSIALVRRAFDILDILDILEKDGAFAKENWKGLDYGCGWGRFGSTMLSRGPASQFDLCDAWQVTLNHLAKLNYQNHVFKVPSLLEKGSVPEAHYDFILSFSVFTHLSPKSFDANLPVLLDALKEDGKLYITVRHDEFIDHKYAPRADELRGFLKDEQYVFVDSGGDMLGEKLFGDMVVTEGYLSNFANVTYLGQPHSLQHVYRLTR